MSKALLELFIPARDIVWGRAVVVHGVLVEVGGVEVGGNLGRDGDVEVAQAQALPVEAVEPPATRSHFSQLGPNRRSTT